ncbi:MAG: SRPBCC domain-containing protein [Azospirillaceae bacterium]|nr:SRPBCC domain-containing protein [Azospirillaceae bacterium]
MPMNGPTAVERTSDREMVVSRTFDAPAQVMFEAWSMAGLFRRWWVPRSMGLSLRSCEMDVRIGGGYRLEFDLGEAKTMAFFGKYLEVTPYSRIVWTNDESEGGTRSPR